MTNVQGFNSRVSSINSDYIVLIAEKKTETEIAENHLILIYKLSDEYHMPFLVFTPESLGMPDSAFASADAGIAIGQNKEPIFFVGYNDQKGTPSLKMFNMGTMKMSLSKDAITKWTSKDKIMVEFLGPKGEKTVREF